MLKIEFNDGEVVKGSYEGVAFELSLSSDGYVLTGLIDNNVMFYVDKTIGKHYKLSRRSMTSRLNFKVINALIFINFKERKEWLIEESKEWIIVILITYIERKKVMKVKTFKSSKALRNYLDKRKRTPRQQGEERRKEKYAY